MHAREIAKARLTVQNAGTPADKKQLLSTHISRLESDLDALRQQKQTIQADYRRRLERWRTEHVAENVPVCALPSDMRASRLYRVTGVFALMSEMALAAWIFSALGIAWWMGVLTALGITLTLHGIFLHLFDDPERPKESVRRIKTFASRPAIFCFLVALALGMLARYVHGDLAVVLLPAFSLALWLGTLSLIILAASLFTVAHIQGWSALHESQYRKVAGEEQLTRAFLHELKMDENTTQSPKSVNSGASSSAQHAVSTASPGFLTMAIAILAISYGMTGCSTAPVSAKAPNSDVTAASRGASLHLFVDTSGSCARRALEESWNTLRRELPELVELHRIRQLTLWQFDVDGWSPRLVRQISLPARRLPVHHTAVNTTEWASFANIRTAVQEADDQEWQRQASTESERYRESLATILKPLDSANVLPDKNYETAQTDVVGLLQRISRVDEREPQDMIILSDLADTRFKVFPKMRTPRIQIRVLVLLVPERPKDAKMSLGRAVPGPQQFDMRVRQLREAAPWVTVAPYFAQDLTALLGGISAF